MTGENSPNGSPAPSGDVPLVIDYVILTETALENWDVADITQKISSDTIAGCYEVLSSVSSNRISSEQGKQLVEPLIQQDLNSMQLFIHTMSLFPLSEALKSLVLDLPLDKDQMLLLMETPMLVQLGLVNASFEKTIIRTNTNMLYKQKRFNLLREESEGYTKLIVELYSAATDKNCMSKIESTMNTIKSLIGYFDLDPIRSLDVIMDVAASNITNHCDFFVQLLKHSPWWPTTLADPTSGFENLSHGGNSEAAQVLGFKLQSMATATTAQGDDTSPRMEVMMWIAILIKEGFISLGGIYESLTPNDKEMEDYEQTWKKEMDEKAFMARASALALAAPLADDETSGSKNSNNSTNPNSNQEKQKASGTKQRKPVKVALLEALLSVGSWYPSLFLLAKFPYIAGAYPELADLIHILVEHVIEPLSPPVGSTIPQQSKPLPCVAHRETELKSPGQPVIRLTVSPLNLPIEKGVEHRFFYENWDSDLQQVHDLDGLTWITETLLKFSGPLLGQSLSLFVRLCQIGAKSFEGNEQFWIEYFRLYLLPCLSILDPNPNAVYEAFELMRKFPMESRYALYGEWQAVLSKASPHLKLATSKAEKDTKDVLKRLSKTNVREMMRKLAKISYSNPIPTFTALISQVESYDNLAELVVDAARYFTEMGWDILPFVIMTQLTSGRGTYQRDGLNDRKWIQCEY